MAIAGRESVLKEFDIMIVSYYFPEFKEELIEIKQKYPQSYFSELIDRMITLVEGIGGGAITPTIKDYIRELY